MSDNLKAIKKMGKVMALSLSLLQINAHAQENDPTDKYFEISKNLEIFSNVFKELNQFYVDPIQPGKMVKTGVDAMLNDLDPYTNLITEADAEDYQLQTTGKYSGVGVTTKIINEEYIVADLFENGPMAKAGIHPGDVIESIDGKNIKGKSNDDVALLMRGAPGTQMKMTTRNPSTKQVSTYTITREEINISSVPYANLIGPQKNIAYVFLTQFTPNCGRDVRNALDSLKNANPNINGVILDLRGNPGGLLDEAVKICNIFIDKGQLVVSTKGKNAEWQKEFTTSGTPWDLKIPVTVLVNHGSASASEIVSGTIQDLDRGVIIGTRSYGKGLVQNVRPLGYNTRLKITTAKYYTPSGRCIQALDYSHRSEDGSVLSVPDSLKKPFKTKAGRTVYDGGGIEPDIKVEDITLSPISKSLLINNYIFNYATEYYYKHKEISTAETFTITDSDFRDFENWLGSKDYGYKTDTEILLDSLKAATQKDTTFNKIQTEYNALAKKLGHDKKADLEQSKKQIMFLLSNEIVSRYYFQKGRAVNRLQYEDNMLQKAVDVLSDANAYPNILKK